MNKKIVIGIIAAVVVIAILCTAYFLFSEKAVEGSKSITISVTDDKSKCIVYELKTDALYLSEAMDEAEGLEYVSEDSTYGAVVTSVNGVEAVYEKNGAYWGFYVNGEYCNYGIDSQPVEDGDSFQIIYTVYEE